MEQKKYLSSTTRVNNEDNKYNDNYLENVKDLLVELEEYIV